MPYETKERTHRFTTTAIFLRLDQLTGSSGSPSSNLTSSGLHLFSSSGFPIGADEEKGRHWKCSQGLVEVGAILCTSRRESRTGDSIDVARRARFLIKTEGQGYCQSAFSEVTDRNYAETTISRARRRLQMRPKSCVLCDLASELGILALSRRRRKG